MKKPQIYEQRAWRDSVCIRGDGDGILEYE